MANQLSDTSTGMIRRVQLGEGEAWSGFADRVRSVVTEWCRWHSIQTADADDLVQETMLVVMARVRSFHHAGRGSLRAWLRAIAWRCWCRAVANADQGRLDSLRVVLQKSTDDIARLEEEYERLFHLDSLHKAMAIAQEKVSAKTWQAFTMTALQEVSGSKAAEALGMTADAVYSCRARVQRLIAIELRRQAESPSASEHSF